MVCLIDDWHEDYGDVLLLRILYEDEAPTGKIGTPLDNDGHPGGV